MYFFPLFHISLSFAQQTCYFHDPKNIHNQRIHIFREGSRNPHIARNSLKTQFSQTLPQILPETHIQVFALRNTSLFFKIYLWGNQDTQNELFQKEMFWDSENRWCFLSACCHSSPSRRYCRHHSSFNSAWQKPHFCLALHLRPQ